VVVEGVSQYDKHENGYIASRSWSKLLVGLQLQ
jgi:hypothetical protein